VVAARDVPIGPPQTGKEIAIDHGLARERMIETIEAEVRATAAELGKSVLSPAVVEALRQVPRHRFVPESEQAFAYSDTPLRIGCGQTISQPYMVAVMTDLLEISPAHRVLEIGTGCGYQAAVLARLAARVYTIELIPELAAAAAERLTGLGYANIEVRAGDGYLGWPDAAPFDRILLTAAPSAVPQTLLDQLAPGGRLIAPVGAAFGEQRLVLVEKDLAGETSERRILQVAFVPMRRGAVRAGTPGT
jgi:protein-L-isoaspartate(D-aspartate) O-methyltransferase